MKTIILSGLALAATATVAMAAPVKVMDTQPRKAEPEVARSGPVQLTDAEMDTIAAGAITDVKVNGGGNTPNGNANGVPTVSLNPAGHAPPGQN